MLMSAAVQVPQLHGECPGSSQCSEMVLELLFLNHSPFKRENPKTLQSGC